MNFLNQTTGAFTPKPWYKQRGGKIFLGILSFLFLALLAFFGLVAYYTWQVKTGKGAALYQSISRGQFTAIGKQDSAGTVPDLKPFIRKHNPVLGEATAPITIIAFIDFECPYCQASYPTMKKVLDKYGPAVRFIFKHMPVAELHPRAIPASLAAACAQEQNTFWPYHDLLFTTKALDDTSLLAHAKTLKLNEVNFASCVDTRKKEVDVQQDLGDAISLGVRGTPTYFINQTRVEGVQDEKTWDSIILQELQRKP